MRLWSIHPKYLDAKGLTALWREGLLARKVLQGKTKGYRNHPQLERFKGTANPVAAIDAYLGRVYKEACVRGYCFNGNKIKHCRVRVKISVTKGQAAYEFLHLKKKLKKRDHKAYLRVRNKNKILLNPVFVMRKGNIESWERV